MQKIIILKAWNKISKCKYTVCSELLQFTVS